jgi:formate dehydrogenase assembly factor FdhD
MSSLYITNHLRRLANQADTYVDADGNLVTRSEGLAEQLWKFAIGYTDEEGIVHKPATWAIQLIFDRLEGKNPEPEADDSAMTIQEKIQDVKKINQLAEKCAADTGTGLSEDTEDMDVSNNRTEGT